MAGVRGPGDPSHHYSVEQVSAGGFCPQQPPTSLELVLLLFPVSLGFEEKFQQNAIFSFRSKGHSKSCSTVRSDRKCIIRSDRDGCLQNQKIGRSRFKCLLWYHWHFPTSLDWLPLSQCMFKNKERVITFFGKRGERKRTFREKVLINTSLHKKYIKYNFFSKLA